MHRYAGHHNIRNCSEFRSRGSKTVNHNSAILRPVSNLPRVALVTLVAASDQHELPAGELTAQIRRALESSPLTRFWAVDKVTVIDEAVDVENEPLLQGE